ncbi:MAG: response regulator [Chloroflexota bacterium]
MHDSGIGIPTDRMDRLFKSFSQVDSSTTRKYGGTGLGLAISKQLCELMGGEMWVESEAASGSTFFFTIKAKGLDDNSSHLNSSFLAKMQNKKVLLVNDNPVSQALLRKQMNAWGIEVEISAPGTDAFLALIEISQEIDAIFLDLDSIEIRDENAELILNDFLQSHQVPPLIVSAPIMKKMSQDKGGNISRFISKPPKIEDLFNSLAYSFSGKDHVYQRLLKEDEPQEVLNLGDLFDLRILLAEDNKVNQKVAVNMFKRLGLTVDIAENGIEVLQMLAQTAYDLIFMDVQMPKMDGLEATKQIAQTWREERPTIIAMTANAMIGDRERFLAAGMDDYISKPVRIHDLQDAIVRRQDQLNQKNA